jgi:hypothetical protein
MYPHLIPINYCVVLLSETNILEPHKFNSPGVRIKAGQRLKTWDSGKIVRIYPPKDDFPIVGRIYPSL